MMIGDVIYVNAFMAHLLRTLKFIAFVILAVS